MSRKHELKVAALLSPLMIAIVAIGCSCGTESGDPGGQGESGLTVASPAFEEGEPIPTRFTADDKDLSPPLRISNVPPGTGSLALICDDPDAPSGVFVHWVIFNLPPETRDLPEGQSPFELLPGRVCQGTNDFGNSGYRGPKPPPGNAHRYFFKLYALDGKLDLEPGASKDDLVKAMKGRIKAEAQLMGTYTRQ